MLNTKVLTFLCESEVRRIEFVLNTMNSDKNAAPECI